MTLDAIVKMWDKKEHRLEVKLDHLERYIFRHIDLKHTVEYYSKKGHFFERYLAGFVHCYILLLKDLSFIILDPIHIFNILVSFAKGIICHPLRSLKNIWGCWSFYYSAGPYGLGVMTANALLAAFIAGAFTALAERGAVASLRTGKEVFQGQVAGGFNYLPRKLVSMAQGVKDTIQTPSESIFGLIMKEPQVVLADAATSIKNQASFGAIRSYKFYTGDLLETPNYQPYEAIDNASFNTNLAPVAQEISS